MTLVVVVELVFQLVILRHHLTIIFMLFLSLPEIHFWICNIGSSEVQLPFMQLGIVTISLPMV